MDTTASATPTVRSDARANRSRLVAAARALFRERGLQVDVKEIADRAGVGIGTVYRNFASKDDLVTAVIEEVRGDIEGSLLALDAEPDPGRRVDRMVLSALEFAGAEGALLEHLAVVRPGAPAPHVAELVQSRFAQAAAAGAIRSDIPPAVLLSYLELHFKLYLALRGEHGNARARDLVVALFRSATHLRA